MPRPPQMVRYFPTNDVALLRI